MDALHDFHQAVAAQPAPAAPPQEALDRAKAERTALALGLAAIAQQAVRGGWGVATFVG